MTEKILTIVHTGNDLSTLEIREVEIKPLREDQKMNTDKFKNEIEQTYYKHFPNSKISVSVKSSLYNSIYIKCFLANDKTELSGGYFINDMFSIHFMIDSNNEELPDNYKNQLPESITLNANAKSYVIKPDNNYMAFGRTRLKFRKATGSPEKIIKSFDKFLAGLKESLLNDIEANKIHNSYVELLNKKLNL